MALPTVTFNSSTGSDTAASGAGPATALTGTGASLDGTTAVDLSADAPDLSGVATDGSAVLWVKTSSGKQFAKIISVDDGTDIVTVALAYSVTESGKTWGIGGKRATFDHADSRLLFEPDIQESGWTIITETDQTITSSDLIFDLGATHGRYATIKGDSASTHRVINQTANDTCISFGAGSGGGYEFFRMENLKITNSNGTKTAAFGIVGAFVTAVNCIFGDVTNTLNRGVSGGYWLIDCEILECTGYGVYIAASSSIHLDGCWVHDCAVGVLLNAGGVSFTTTITDCVIEDNTGDGFATRGSSRGLIKDNVFDGNGGDGIDLTVTTGYGQFQITGNTITSNGNYGIRSSASNTHAVIYEDYNNFGTGASANTSGDVLGFTKGSNDVAVDPQYVNPASNNFAGGRTLQNIGFPSASRNIGADQSSTIAYKDIGIQGDTYWGGASGPLTLSKETGAAARGGSGTCAKLLPLSTASYGEWPWFVPTDGSAFVLSFYYWATSGFNGDIHVTIYDVDNETVLLDEEDVGETADGSWRQYTATSVDPDAAGLCRVVVAVKQGANDPADVIYIDDVVQA